MENKNYILTKNFQIKSSENKLVDSGKKEQNRNLLLAKYTSVGYYLIAPLLIGVFFGLSIDSFLQSKPIATIMGLLVGIISVFYNLKKIINDVAHQH